MIVFYMNDIDIKQDGEMVEPKYYIPIVPMLLLNGSEGIGTGWSTNIPQYNLLQVIDVIKNKLQ